MTDFQRTQGASSNLKRARRLASRLILSRTPIDDVHDATQTQARVGRSRSDGHVIPQSTEEQDEHTPLAFTDLSRLGSSVLLQIDKRIAVDILEGGGDVSTAIIMSEEEYESPLRYYEGMFFSSFQDDYCMPAPSHPPELHRLEYLHNIFQTVIGNIPDEVSTLFRDGHPHHVLDVGCGTGQWAKEICETYPNVEVTAIDLVDVPLASHPSNFEFEIRDVTLGLQYKASFFDVVHIRDIGLGIRDYSELLRQCVHVLKPGGWLLVLELEWEVAHPHTGENPEERYPHLVQLLKLFREAMQERGLNPWLGYNLYETIDEIPELGVITSIRTSAALGGTRLSPTQTYIANQSQKALCEFVKSVKIMLQDYGIADPSEVASEALAEVEEDGDGLCWFFDFCAVRKLSPAATADDEDENKNQ
ncbi:hypothetical protein M231_02090 [Tremella mesenterica]|uniref:Methyltransferase domain-containing protein n=1 Tax=Tremella mesenterica TaxID=5217 RepID=A0A4Q1BRM8_TREME|nr:hypothetical protein M231_02090 [Tremella mesenterica]